MLDEPLMYDSLLMYLPLVMMMLLGYIVASTRYLPASVGESLMQYMMRLPIPLVIFHGVTRIHLDQVPQALPFVLVYTAVQLLFFYGSYAVFRLSGFSYNASVSLSTTIIMPNLVFFALPVILVLPHADKYLYLFMMGLFVTTVLLALVVVPMFRFDTAKDKDTGGSVMRQCLIETLSTPIVLGLLLGTVVMFSGYSLPQAVDQFLLKFSTILNTSGLIALGMGMSFKFLQKTDIEMWAAVLTKSVFMPLITLWIARVVGLDKSHQLVLVLISACPTGALAAMVAMRFSTIRGQVIDIFAGSTILSILIYGFWVHIARMQLAI